MSLGARAPFWQSREIVSLARTVMVSQCSSNFRKSSILLHCRIAYSQDLIILHEHLADLLGSIPKYLYHSSCRDTTSAKAFRLVLSSRSCPLHACAVSSVTRQQR